jgi:hypothetical protein
MQRKPRFVHVFLAMAVLHAACGKAPAKVGNLRTFDDADIRPAVEAAAGSGGVIRNITRNSDGTRMYVEWVTESRDIKILSLSVASPAAKPRSIDLPGVFGFPDEALSIRAYTDSKPDARGYLSIRFGANVTRKALAWSVDPSGEYYFAEVSPGTVEIARTAEPLTVLAESKLAVERIFMKAGRVYLFGRAREKGWDEQKTDIAYQVLRLEGTRLIADSDGLIGRPKGLVSGGFEVVDVDSSTDAVLLKVVHDDPLCSRWYLYHLDSKERSSLGCARDHGLFLAGDLPSASSVRAAAVQ